MWTYLTLFIFIVLIIHQNSNGEFSDGLDEFEESADESKFKSKVMNALSVSLISVSRVRSQNETTFKDKPYDEAVEFSQDLSVNESYDARSKQVFLNSQILSFF